ncbi:4-hydroxybenzoate polyprenyltransferase [Paenibacillus curdlanolyticus YK9]|uniref:4-hydroxybenzoate polyprenyltransferase n=1 Tax=Paenibacillus curdlanolyticus YK9 TaxID=717606 RepID=E0IC86_9BACL|nr:UbiA-like polyprenyltransferase [Paenibacillus curdlanolyticus]EFM09772.1 4-hydroxybenzoate polyprenyltransferase [Paenibacillus curdlanolyticus YK9]
MIRKIRIFLEMIKFEHTVFALPFAFMGAILGAITTDGRWPSWAEIGWILLAMVGARTAAMALNRLIDRGIDALNPRTEQRAIPAGLLKVSEVVFFIIVSFAVLIYASSQLNALCVKLMPLAVFMLVLYSYTKRFTWLCHVVLGLTIGLSPLGAWVAVTGQFAPAAWVLFGTVALWLAGFDIIYATQDFEFDRSQKLHSIPARFGIRGALWIARSLHFVTAIGFITLFFMTDLSWAYLVGTIISCIILFYQHWLVRPNDLSRVQIAFFPMNGTLSVVLFAFTFVDLLVFWQW